MRHRAFTLVELLVVISIISVVIALLMPALVAARRQVQWVQCQANLRTIGHGLILYTQQYRYYPGWHSTGTEGGGETAIWPTRIRAMLG